MMLKYVSMFLHISVSALLAAILTVACTRSEPNTECRDEIGCVRISAGDPVKLGLLQALSGKVAALGLEQVRGIQLAIEQHRTNFLDHPITFRIEDTGCTAEGGANAALKLIADPQTVAILGTTCSGAAATAAHAMSDAGLTMISGNNSAPFLTAVAGKRAPHWHAGYFRTSFNEESSGKAAALFAFHKLGVRRAATINDGDIYTKGLTNGFEKVFGDLGGQIALSTTVDKGDIEMQPVLMAVLNSKVELLFFPLFQPEGNHLLLRARDTDGFEKIALMSGGALIEESFIQNVRSAAKGMYFVGPAYPRGQAVESLAKAYLSMFKIQPATNYYLSAYDAAGLLLTAIGESSVQEPDGTLNIGRNALRQALYTTNGWQGITGTLTCDQFGDCADPVFNVLRLDNVSAGVQGLRANVQFTYNPTRQTTK